MGQHILSSTWLPFREALIAPLETMCRLFYNGDPRGAWEEARFAADTELHGIYKVFIRIATPDFLMRNSSMILGSYFSDAELKIVESTKQMIRLRIHKVELPHVLFDNLACGWIEQALEICGCKKLQVAVVQSAMQNKAFTEILITWE